MIGEPRLEERAEQPYVGIRTQTTMRQLGKTIPETLDELDAWCREREITPAAAPFIRYHVIDMQGALDVELGVPVASPRPGDGRVTAGVLPAGRYAALIYSGVKNGVAGNKALLDWGAPQGLAWDRWTTERGDAFGSRLESFLTLPEDEPDPAKWEAEVAIRLADR